MDLCSRTVRTRRFVPVADVSRAIDVLKSASTLSHVILPLSSVRVATGVDQSTIAIDFVVLPVTFVLATITPDDGTSAFSLPIDIPLAVIVSTIGEFKRTSSDDVAILVLVHRNVNEFAESFLKLFGRGGREIR